MVAIDERTAWIALSATVGIGEGTFWSVIARYGGAANVLQEAARGARLIGGDDRNLPARTMTTLRETAGDPKHLLRRLDELGIWTTTPMDADYPTRMAVIDPQPIVIYGWGDRAALERARSVAVVGTRRPTLSGRDLASRVGARLAEAGAVVVSGLAIGIDGAAHAAAVAAGGQSVAVIGGGHCQPGPRAHRSLLRAILDVGGAVISEYAPDVSATKGTYPRRNRIISALGDATIVIEAPARSGALITARHALEQGRQLFVAPGRPGDRHIAGCLALLRETDARPLIGLDELIVDLGWDAEPGATARPPGATLSLESALDLLGPAGRAVARRVAAGPVSADALVEETGLAPPVVSGAITLLMLRGWVQAFGPAYLPAGPLLTANHR